MQYNMPVNNYSDIFCGPGRIMVNSIIALMSLFRVLVGRTGDITMLGPVTIGNHHN
jgi:hypothetical protein